MNTRFCTHRLDNGLRVVIESMPAVKTVAAGFLCRTGARDEPGELAGVSHFLEHLCFKGTPNRDARTINLDFDRIGGQHNAFTSQDRTFYYSAARSRDAVRQIDILADMMRSIIPPDEFETEKKVVLEEIAMSGDRIESVAFDAVLENVFAGHTLGWPVLGYDRTLEPMTRDEVLDYHHRRYVPANMTLVVAGGVETQQVLQAAGRYCGTWDNVPTDDRRCAPVVRTGSVSIARERFNQQMLAINFAAPSAVDPLHETALTVAAILGGANSRFHWNIEQAGISPHAGAYRLDYGDCGLLILMAQCDPDNAQELHDALRAEARKLMTGPIDDAEIQRVKNKRRTALAVEGESPYHRLVQVMDDVDYRGAPRTVEDRLAAVQAVNHESINRYFEQYPIDGDGFLVSVGPREFPGGGWGESTVTPQPSHPVA